MKYRNKEMRNRKSVFVSKVQNPVEIHMISRLSCQVRINSKNFGSIQTLGNNTKVQVPNKRKM